MRLVLPEDCREGAACFQSPVPLDIVLDGIKICGGALRRSKAGVLYQGSLRLRNIPIAAIGAALSKEYSKFSPPTKMEENVVSLLKKNTERKVGSTSDSQACVYSKISAEYQYVSYRDHRRYCFG